MAKWEVFDQEELEKRVEKNLLKEGSKLFKVEQEIAIRFEKITHLD
ncbi:MAG: hypothetical protein GY866_02120 [Proteobacteria bacterium]|nr:hypothetical protein [Pseudomonadota bacterium]